MELGGGAPIGPYDFQGIDHAHVSQTKMKAWIHAWHTSPHGIQFLEKQLSPGFKGHLAANRCGIAFWANEGNIGKMVIGPGLALIPVDKRWHVDIAHHQVQVSIIVHISVSRSAGKSRFPQSPHLAYIGELHIPPVSEQIIWDRHRGHVIDQFLDHDSFLPVYCSHFLRHEIKVGIILVKQIFNDTIGYKYLFESIIVQVGHKGAPTPICGLHTGKAWNLTKMDPLPGRAIVELENISGKLSIVAISDL